MARAMPALSFHFGLRWEHVEVMPRFELDAYLDALEDMNSR